MAFRDIRPYSSARGDHTRILHFRMGALTTDSAEDTSWLEGNIMLLSNTVGDIDAHIDGTLAPDGGLAYLAAAGSADLILKNGGTSGAATHDIMVPVYDFTQGDEFTTANISAGDDTQLDLDSATVLIGTTADLWVDDSVATMVGHLHGLDNAGDYFVITRKLDANGRNSLITGETTVEIVFKRAA